MPAHIVDHTEHCRPCGGRGVTYDRQNGVSYPVACFFCKGSGCQSVVVTSTREEF